MAHYNKVELKAFFSVTHIVEILYRGLPKEKVIDYKKNYDFWCFYYVDRGHVVFHMEGGESVVIGSGQGVLFAPFHSFVYSETTADDANILSVFFNSPDLDKDSFHNRQWTFDMFERMILSQLVTVSQMYFERYSNNPNGPKGSKPRDNAPGYVLHFVKASLEYLLLLLYQSKDCKTKQSKTPVYQMNLTVNLAVEYMYQNLDKKLTVKDIASHVKMSESNFQAVFKKYTQQSVMDYFHTLKIEQAKILIRKEIYNQKEIAALLGYNTESYFCRHFKKKTGMTPSEYARLVYYG